MKEQAHWENFYASKAAPEHPSQFAAFALGECAPRAVVDFGCGNGRDSLFFGRQGISCISVDSSGAAVQHCRSRAEEQGLKHVNFIESCVQEPELGQEIVRSLRNIGAEPPVMCYARFFIHAIDEDSEMMLLEHVACILSNFDGKFCAEFRSTRDKSLEKATAEHFRRFVDVPAFIGRTHAQGFRCSYLVEGFGMAKFKNDDAYVVRVVLER